MKTRTTTRRVLVPVRVHKSVLRAWLHVEEDPISKRFKPLGEVLLDSGASVRSNPDGAGLKLIHRGGQGGPRPP